MKTKPESTSAKRTARLLRIIALVTAYIFYAQYLFVPYLYADVITDTASEGSTFGNSISGSYTVNSSTNPSGTVPWYDDAKAQQGNYTQYYSNPGGMEPAGEATDAHKWIEDTYAAREKIDITSDPVFGYKCLEKDAAGKCITWSSSRTILYNSYEDCETTTVTTYDDPQTEKTCTGTHTSLDNTCQFTSTPSVTAETVTTPCNQFTLDVPANQIMARCTDNYKWYKVDKGMQAGVGDGCVAHGFFAWQPATYEPGAPPANATNFCQYWTLEGCDDNSGLYHIYEWHPAYVNSRIERVSLSQSQGGCADFDEKMASGNCVVTDMTECNYARTSCVNSIENSEATGSTQTDLCAQFTGELDTYTMCLANTYISAGETTFGYGQISATPQWSSRSDPYNVDLGATRGVQTAYTITKSRVLGGNDVKTAHNYWYATIKLNCKEETDSCQTLIDEGCYYDRSECVDDYCTQRIYTYKCGGTGKATGYTQTVTCDGEVRCMGTECKDVVKVESSSFGDAATAGEILNNIRVDTAEGNRVFPGQPFSCQDEPKNCCDGAVEGVSITDYISAASATYKVGTTAFEYFAPEMYKSLTWVGKEMMLMVVPDALQTSVVGELVGTVANFSLETTVKTIGVEVTMAAAESIGVTVSETAVASAVGAVVGMIGTVLWVVAILYAIYTILSFVWKILFQCTEEDQATSVKLTLKLCHQVGQTRINTLGMALKRRNVYCCFNSMLARIIHEQGRPQVGKTWGTPEAPDCSGFTIGDISNLDFSAMDLSEYMDYVESKTEMNVDEKLDAAEKAATKIEDAAETNNKTP